MKLNIKQYKGAEEWSQAITQSIDSSINLMLAKQDKVNLLLSGGSTPGPVYKNLDSELTSCDQIRIGLVDERFFTTNHADSNEKLIKGCFNSRPEEAYIIIGMVEDAIDESENLKAIRKSYEPFIKQTDIVVLGMGGDGHTASIFPNDPESDEVKKNGINSVFSTKAPSDPKNRITCSLDLITNASEIYLLISGNEKLKVLEGYQFNLPIHNVLERRPDVQIYYLEK